jgi:hypothetical protein
MSRFHSAAAAFGLALAVLFGQQAAALHALAHAIERIQQNESVPAKTLCDQCFHSAQLAGAVGVPDATPEAVAFDAPRSSVYREVLAHAAPRIYFLSRAPPRSA